MLSLISLLLLLLLNRLGNFSLCHQISMNFLSLLLSRYLCLRHFLPSSRMCKLLGILKPHLLWLWDLSCCFFLLNEYFITNTTQTHFFILKKFYILLHLYTMMTQLLVIIYLFYLWLALCLWNTTASTNCTISVNIFYAIWNRQKSTKKKEIIDEKLNSRDTSVPFKIEPKNETCV